VHRTCRLADFGSGSVWITFAILAALSETPTAVAHSQDLSRSIYIRELDAAISFNEVVDVTVFSSKEAESIYHVCWNEWALSDQTKK
jgi:hypothetical protein